MICYGNINLGGSEIMIIGSYLAIILFVYFIIAGVKAFFQELNK